MIIKELGLVSYETTWQQMREFTTQRTAETPDELWFCEHLPVFTQGRHCDELPLLNPLQIPVFKTDRGGQITYHGPGQLMVYCLVDLKRRKMGVMQWVCILEDAVIAVLAKFGITGHRREGMPGIYVNNAKIGSLGLRVKQGCTYHGLALNVAMDLTPFSHINPCGYTDLTIVQMRDFVSDIDINAVMNQFKLTEFATLFITPPP